MIVRLASAGDTEQVRAIYASVHPDPKDRSDAEWASYKIHVACDGRWDKDPDYWPVVGYTAADLTIPGVLRGVETLVRPEYQGRGVGRALMEARLAASPKWIFVGATALDNQPMRRLLEQQGMVARERFTYADGKDGIIYASPF